MIDRLVTWLMMAMMWMAGLTYCVFVAYGMCIWVRDMFGTRKRERRRRRRVRAWE